MADKHSITFDTGLDNSDLEKELQDTVKKIQKATQIQGEATGKRLKLLEDSKQLTVNLDEAKEKLHQLQKEKESIQAAVKEGVDTETYVNAYARKDDNAKELTAQEKNVERLQAKWDKVQDSIEQQEAKIKEATEEIEIETQKAGELRQQLDSPTEKVQEGFQEAAEKAKKLEQTVARIAMRVFVFQIITKILRSAREYFSGLLAQNEEYQAKLAQLRAALATAFQPLYEVALPILLKVLSVLTDIVSVAAYVISALFGKSFGQSAKNAKGLNKEAAAMEGVGNAAKEAAKQVAGFDEINQLSDNNSNSGGGGGGIGGGGGGTMDFDGLDTDEYKQKIEELTVYISGALLALGAILAFSGVNIPLGLALMAVGAAGLAAVIMENWGAIPEKLKKALTITGLLVGGALLALGAILAFSGRLPLGIALMAAGAASLVAVAALNWDAVKTALQGPLGQAMAAVSGYLLVLGAVLAFGGVSLPLGIALMAAGAAGLVTVGALNWDAILTKLKEAWNGIKQWYRSDVAPKLTLAFWQDKFSGISEALGKKIKDGSNAAAALINRLINWVNGELFIQWGGLEAFGQTIIPPGSMQLFTIPPIPMLAQGAVIPPNAPFMAMLGDQRHGTNIETPEDLLRKIVREETGGTDRELMQEQNDLLRRILERTGTYIDGRKLTDTVTMYQKRDAMARGV